MSAMFTSSCESQECDFCGAVVGQCCRHCTAHEAKDDDDQGRVAQAWLADPEVTPLWRARGSLGFRVACLTPAGRRLLADWSPETGV